MSSISTISSSNVQYYDFSKYPLSRDILIEIFAHLNSPEDVRALSLANRSLFQIFSDSNLSLFWDRLLEKHFPNRGREETTKPPRDAYQQLKIIRNNMITGQYRLQTISGSQDSIFSTSATRLLVHDNQLISGLDDSTIKIWDIEDGRELLTLTGHQDSITSLLIHNGKLISGSWDGSIIVWDPENGRKLQSFNHKGSSRLLVHNDKLISGSTNGTIKVWDPENERELRTLNHGSSIYFLLVHNGKLVSSSMANIIKVWDLESGSVLQTLQTQAPVNCMLVHEGKLIYNSINKTIKMWDLNNGCELLTLPGHQRIVTCLLIHDGKLISGSYDNTIKIWDLKNGCELLTLSSHQNTITCFLIHDGKLISGSDKTIKIWDLENGKKLQTFTNNPQGWISNLLFHNGKLICDSALDSGHHAIKIYDFNFPALTPYSKETLQEGLTILSEMAKSPQKSDAANLHPDFQERLKQHAVRVGTYPHYSLEVVCRVQIELCIEMLLKAIHTKDWKRVSQTIDQLIQTDPENENLYNDLLWHFFSPASLVKKEEAALELKNSLKERWG